MPTAPTNEIDLSRRLSDDKTKAVEVEKENVVIQDVPESEKINENENQNDGDSVNTDAVDEAVSDPISEENDTKRSSIADRRKLYESRSLSLIDEKKKSSAIGRGESFKESEEQNKDKNDSKANGSLKTAKTSKRTSTVFGKVSKFRHLKGTTGHKSTHIENIKNINRQISGECDGFHGN